MSKDSRIVETQQLYFNKHFGFFYNDFFNNNKNYYFLVFENINLTVFDQLNILNKLKHICSFCKIKKKILRKLFSKWNSSIFFLHNPIILKVHNSNLFEFMSLMQTIYNLYLNFVKKEKQFFDFSFLLYEMSSFYMFNTFLNNYFKVNNYLVYFNTIYKFIILLSNFFFL